LRREGRAVGSRAGAETTRGQASAKSGEGQALRWLDCVPDYYRSTPSVDWSRERAGGGGTERDGGEKGKGRDYSARTAPRSMMNVFRPWMHGALVFTSCATGTLQADAQETSEEDASCMWDSTILSPLDGYTSNFSSLIALILLRRVSASPEPN